MAGRFGWSLLLGVAIGAAVGVGGFTFLYARGASYLGNDPATCANCHVMQRYFDGWSKGSHRSVATCNDCHTPPGVVPKYWTKGVNGFWHSFAFTSGDFPDPIRIKTRNTEIANASCLKCHEEMVEAMAVPAGAEGVACTRCHESVGHLH